MRNLPDYDKYDLSSLKFALYGGQQVTRIFLEKLSKMASNFGSLSEITPYSNLFTKIKKVENPI